MRLQPRVLVLVLALTPLLLTGCSATAAPAPTVTVTATPPPATLGLAEAPPWDLHAVCAAESEIRTVERWRDEQTAAERLSSSASDAVLQTVAVQYLELGTVVVPGAVRKDIRTLVGASGTLEHPAIDLSAASVQRARRDIGRICRANALTISITAQGG